MSGYDANVQDLGTKWEIVTVSLNLMTERCVSMEFDTAWGSCSEWAESFADRFDLDLIHTYCEAGCGFCGQAFYENGVVIDTCSDALELSEEKDVYGDRDVVGPDYVLSLSSYGG
ncbi:hypothetical protein [Vibrio sp. 10N.261.46.A3]|uniref:DUF1281 family ferredoxin-like fold protein n=1 Tax=Vibrio sp. 10N.261.46.A3 TaxID=3229658 RepID=UPI00354F2C81